MTLLFYILFVNNCSFESLVIYLREPNVIQITKQILDRIHLLCTMRHRSSPPALPQSPLEHVKVKVFLSAFMIVFHPHNVLENMSGKLEQALLKSAKQLMDQFQAIIHSLIGFSQKKKQQQQQSTPPPLYFNEIGHKLTKTFQQIFFNYLEAFNEWKVKSKFPFASFSLLYDMCPFFGLFCRFQMHKN